MVELRSGDLKSRLDGVYALSVYLPVAEWARRLQILSRRIRGKSLSQPTKLPRVSWRRLGLNQSIRLVECAKANGNVRLSELAVLAKAAAGVKAGTEIIEIGTFDGRTTLNLAANSAPACRIFTLDLLPSTATTFHLDPGEKAYVEKPRSGARFKNDSALARPYTSKIVQLFGDSAMFDWSAHVGKASLVFVDGSHTYQYVKKDTETAFKLAGKGGVIFWHDYGVWDGVTQALENIEACEKIGLLHIRGTSLVYAKVR